MAVSRPRVFLDLNIGAEPIGRLVIELFSDKAPKACENFLALCTGSHPPLSYKESRFHRIIDEFMVQGGDITKSNGTGGESIYGGEFEDENLHWRKIDKEGLVCMANRGKGTNSSQFFITLAPCEHLNGKHTVFGQLLYGEDVLERMAKVNVDKDDKPRTDVVVSHCGELERRKKAIPFASNTTSNDSNSEHRGRRKRQRSSISEDSSSRSPSRQGKHRKQNQISTSPSPDRFPTKKRTRRRSDHSVDENLRGRPRQRSKDHARTSSPIEEDNESPPRHARHRSPSPSRRRRGEKSHSSHYRRRRSLPNHYERLEAESRSRREEELPQQQGIEQGGRDSLYNGDADGDRFTRRSHHGGSERLRNDGEWENHGGWGEIKYKGRGKMKHRERPRF